MFDFQQLHVYQRALSFLSFSSRLSLSLPRSSFGLADHLRRAALSVQLNIAEGMGRPGGEERTNFLRIARGSAMECAAALEAVEAMGFAPGKELQAGRELLLEVVRMLTVMGNCTGRRKG
jgi:four helix bundle protein